MPTLDIPLKLPTFKTSPTPPVVPAPAWETALAAKAAAVQAEVSAVVNVAKGVVKLAESYIARLQKLAGLVNKPITLTVKIKGITVFSQSVAPLSVVKKLI